MINLTSMYAEKFSSFECGFHSFLGQNRSQFHVKFFSFALLFLLFDLEITLIYPFAISIISNSIYGLMIVLIFMIIITIGFVYEVGKGALKIDSKQNTDISIDNNSKTFISYFEKGVILGTNNSYISRSSISGGLFKNTRRLHISLRKLVAGNVGTISKSYSTNSKHSSSISRSPSTPKGFGVRRDGMKNFYRELRFSLAMGLLFILLFTGPLKGLTHYTMSQVLYDSYYYTIGVALFIIFSGLISYIVAKSIQYAKGKGPDMNLHEFFFIFTISITITTFFIFIGYPLLGYFLGGGL